MLSLAHGLLPTGTKVKPIIYLTDFGEKRTNRPMKIEKGFVSVVGYVPGLPCEYMVHYDRRGIK
jgi:hypothetical protein